MAFQKLPLLFLFILSSVLAAPSDVDNSARSIHLTPEIIIEAGYHAERHHVTTSDGYILEMHRIPFKRGMSEGDPNRPVVLLMHGMGAASNGYIFLGPEYAPGYNLADAGCDVWMGNARGTRNSRFHVTMDADNRDDRREFFDFSWEEIGMVDVAAMVDYALAQSGRQQLHYLGHSQGGTAFLVLASTRPEYNEKFASVHLLAGVGYKTHFPNIVLRLLARYTTTIYNLAMALGVVELIPPIGSIIGPSAMENSTNYDAAKYRLSDFCTGDPAMKDLCTLMGLEEILEDNDSGSILDVLDGIHLFGGISMKQLAHYGQNIRDDFFRKWDYGPEANYELYGSNDPPIFDISLITADVTMHYTIADTLLDERDVIAMANDMPNTKIRKVARETFGHGDFIGATDARELVTEYIIEYIWRVENGPPIVPDSSEEDINVPDSSEEDINVPDTSEEDTIVPDTSEEDINVPDSSEEDINVPDSSEEDINVPDTSEEDTNVPDTSEEDINVPDTSEEDINVSDTSEEGSGEPDSASSLTLNIYLGLISLMLVTKYY